MTKLFLAGAAHSVCRDGAIICFSAGSIITIIHATGYGFKYLIPALLTLSLLTLITFALCRGRKSVPPEQTIIALLDSRSNTGGLLVSQLETGLGGWEAKLELPPSPQVICRFGAKPWILLFAAAFLIAGCFTSNAVKPLQAERKMDITGDAQKMAEQINVLHEEKVLTEQEMTNFTEQLKNLSVNASGEDPLKTWEALDHLNRAAMEKAAVAAENTMSTMSQMEMLEKTAGLLADAEAKSNEQEFSNAMQSFQSLLNNLGTTNPALQKLANSGNCKNATDLKNFQSKCNQGSQNLKRSLDNMRRCGALKDGQQNGKGPSEKQAMDDLNDFIKKNCDSKAGQCLGKMCNKPGDGGTSRGRGDAPMTWDKREVSHNGGYKEISLPPPTESGLQNSELMGITAGAPEAKPSAEIKTGNLTATNGKAEMNKLVIQPRHRQSVSRYFNHRPTETTTQQPQQ